MTVEAKGILHHYRCAMFYPCETRICFPNTDATSRFVRGPCASRMNVRVDDGCSIGQDNRLSVVIMKALIVRKVLIHRRDVMPWVRGGRAKPPRAAGNPRGHRLFRTACVRGGEAGQLDLWLGHGAASILRHGMIGRRAPSPGQMPWSRSDFGSRREGGGGSPLRARREARRR